MAVVTKKSTYISNRDATPVVLTNPSVSEGKLQEAQGYVTTGADDSIGSKYILGSVPSNARVSQVLLSCAAITSGAADIGVYYPTAVGGTAGVVIDADLFASAQSIATALSNSDVTAESGEYTIAEMEMPLWQAAGLSVDPGGFIDIVATLTAATTAAGLLGLKTRYVQG